MSDSCTRTVKTWMLRIKFKATEEMANEIRDTLNAMGINTKRNGFHQIWINLDEVDISKEKKPNV